MYGRRAFHYPHYFYDWPEPSYGYPPAPLPLPTCRHALTLLYVEHPSAYYDYVHRRSISPTIIQTNVRNDISYHLDDDFVYPSRSRMLVSHVPTPRRRTVVVRDRSLPAVLPRPTRLAPLYHSTDAQYLPTARRRRVMRL